MRVAHLSLTDFRNYESVDVALKPGANLLFGRNGQGKTNLVEAIAYFASLKSHRVSNDAALIRAGSERAIARLRAAVGAREVVLELELTRGGRMRARVNRNEVSARELTRWFASVTFAPEDLSIVKGEPSIRRRFLDHGVVSRHPVASGTLSDYERVLRQRSTLLKSVRSSGARNVDDSLAVWDDQLVELGSQIMLARRELVAALQDPLRRSYETLVRDDHSPTLSLEESVFANVSRETAPNSDVDFIDAEPHTPRVVSRETIAESFRSALANIRGKELDRGVSLVGPHRDDLTLSLNGLPVKGYASHGESWSFSLSLRLALAQVMRAESAGGDPVMILDDVFAELDTGRRERLMTAVMDFEQVIVTAAVAEDVPDSVDWHRIEIDVGTATEVPA